MIDKKTILYILLGVTIFALWEAWQKDYEKPKIQNQTTVEAATNLPSIAPPLPASREKKSEVLAATPAPTSRLVTVHTDVLDVAIDTLGGNIVRADLVRYPEIIHQTKPIRLLNDDTTRYYVAESGLISATGRETNDRQTQYTTAQKEYRLESSPDELQGRLKVKLLGGGAGGVTVAKVFTFNKGKYDVGVDYEIDNKSNSPWTGRFYADIKRKNFDASSGWFQFNTYTGAAVSSLEKPYEKISFSDIEAATKNGKEVIRDNHGGWVAMQQRYFLSIWVPNQERTYNYFNRSKEGIYTVGFSDNAIMVPAGEKDTVSAVLYVGPGITENIAHFAKGLDRTVDYGWLWLISIGFFWVLKNIYKLVGNWGWSIILVTLLIKLAFYKLSESSCRSMAKMRDLMPKIQALKERYGDDRQKLHQATMELYQREKVNPLSFGGCLPMLIQIPFFIALYYVLIGAVELRQAPFMFWLNDLSARDPYYVLPILMGISMLVQQRLTPSSADPAQAKMMMFMPVIFTMFFLNFPSGLVLYWFVSNLLSILQQWYINKKLALNVVRG